MKIEPVYLVAPIPEDGSRRRFFGLSIAAVVAALGGGGVGFLLGSADSEETSEDVDPELQQLLRLALDAPVDELLKAGPYFLFQLQRAYSWHPDLWRGFDRLVEQLSEGPLDSRQRDLALCALDLLENSAADGASARTHWLPVLRRRR